MKRLLVLLSLATACFSPERALEGGGPPLGYETNVRACDDGRDNDRDGLVDCFDPDCIARNFCGEQIFEDDITEPEDTVLRCIDRIDNDRDGQFDCGDRGCQAIAELCCAVEFSDTLCSNYMDDDGNNFADCQDFGCRNGRFVTVCENEATFPPRRPGEDTCADGLDNDGDGRIDCNDDQCVAERVCCTGPTCDETTEGTLATCTDRIDNDRNGFTDCADFACSRFGEPEAQAFCDGLPREDSFATCSNGIDEDRNGFTDCADFSCCDRDGVCLDEALQEFCDDQPTETTAAECTNGIDDDGNGFTDCSDFSCSRSGDPAVRALCACTPGQVGGVENRYICCVDRVDQDENGFTDCGDFSCNFVANLRAVDLDLLAGDGLDRFPFGDLDGDGQVEDFDQDGVPDDEIRSDIDPPPFFGSPCDESRTASDIRSEYEELVEAAGNDERLLQRLPAAVRDDLEEAIEEAVQRCSDGIDEDLDGFVDCADWDCQWNPLLNPRASRVPPFDQVRGEVGFCQGGRWDRDVTDVVWTAEPRGDGDRGRSVPESERQPLLCR